MEKPARIAALFGGSDKYRQAIKELENEIYAA
jgi:EcoEI R protein C-terminal.